MNIIIREGDLSAGEYDTVITTLTRVCVDTETTGLDPNIDKLCTVQLLAGSCAYIFKITNNVSYKNLSRLMTNNRVTKIFHNAVFDIRFIGKCFSVSLFRNVFCTKIAAKLLYGPGKSTSLKILLKDSLGIDISKEMQLSDWSGELSDAQINYAISDVLYLEALWDKLYHDVCKQKKKKLLYECMRLLPVSAYLKNQGYKDIFDYA